MPDRQLLAASIDLQHHAKGSYAISDSDTASIERYDTIECAKDGSYFHRH